LTENTESPVRVIVADDHPVVREGLRSFLATRPGIDVVGEAADADGVVRRAESLRPDVVLVDLVMPGDGIEAIRRLQALPTPPRVLVLTSFTGDDKVVPALRAGAAGYLLKDVDPLELEAAIHTIHRGGTLLSPSASAPLIDAVRADAAPAQEDERLARLSPRERDVLDCLARGLSNRAIAGELYVSEKTVKTHVSSILSKLRVADRTQAAVYALRHGIGAGTDDLQPEA
jgi:DNA-binding NarL/FixJ family response regulator